MGWELMVAIVVIAVFIIGLLVTQARSSGKQTAKNDMLNEGNKKEGRAHAVKNAVKKRGYDLLDSMRRMSNK